jgi:Low-density lipoprotein receptor domain class A
MQILFSGCQEGYFVCKDKKKCIDQSKVLDGVNDCLDGSDEGSCN